jgi:hypothetical protein
MFHMDPLTVYLPALTLPSLGALASALAVLAACAALGSAVGRGGRPGDLIAGTGAAGGALAVWGLMGLSLSLGAALLGLLALAALTLAARRRILPGGWLWAAVAVLAAFLVLAAGSVATMWDDFFHWLPNAAYVVRNDVLPGPGAPDSLSKWPAYPYTMPFLVAASSWLAGRFLEGAGPVANVAFLGAFGAMVVDAALEGRAVGRSARWALAAVAAALATVLNPAFDHHVLFSSYADILTAVAVAACGLSGARVLEAAERGEPANGESWRFALAAVALVNLKQANLVLFALLIGSLGVVALRMGRRTALTALRQSPVLVLPGALMFALWRIEVLRLPTEGEMSFRALSTWNFGALGMMAGRIAGYMADVPAFYILMYAALILGLIALIRRPATPARRLLAVAALCWIGYNAFLILVYLGAMTQAEAEMAADYWRYAPHLGPLALAGVALYAAEFAARRTWTPSRNWWLAAPVTAALLAVFAQGLSPLHKTWPMHYRAVGREARDLLPNGARVGIYVGHNLDAMAVAVRYDLSGQDLPADRDVRGRIVWHGAELPPVMDEWRRGALTHLLITDARKPMDDAVRDWGIPPLSHETALFAWTGEGWTKLKSWPAQFRD